jgi:type I restriction enzyme S subunit
MSFCYGAFCSKIELHPKYRAFLSQFFTSDYFARKIRTIVVGTSIKNINNSHLTGNLVAFPPEQVLVEFEKIINPMIDMQGKIVKENQELASLRDFLLPLLMNGQVGFKEVDE